MSKRVLPLTLLALLALAGCRTLETDTLACERLADWSDRKACLDKVKVQEREWEKRTN